MATRGVRPSCTSYFSEGRSSCCSYPPVPHLLTTLFALITVPSIHFFKILFHNSIFFLNILFWLLLLFVLRLFSRFCALAPLSPCAQHQQKYSNFLTPSRSYRPLAYARRLIKAWRRNIGVARFRGRSHFTENKWLKRDPISLAKYYSGIFFFL